MHHASFITIGKNRSPRARVASLCFYTRRRGGPPPSVDFTITPAALQSSCCTGVGFGGITFSLMAFTYGPATSIPLTTYGSAMVFALAT